MNNYPSSCQRTNATVTDHAVVAMSSGMPMTFREAFVWHLENYPQKISEIEAETGVSRDQLYRVKTGRSASTNADDALRVARFYGKTLEEFINCAPSHEERQLDLLWEMLSEEERKALVLQMRWMVERKDSDPGAA